MDRPNLFKFAPSELSQDAFICWLLSWATPELKINDDKLHSVALLLFDEFFNLSKFEKPQIETIHISRQVESIDILVEINKNTDQKFAIIIEDKTDTSDHHEQLQRYYHYVNEKLEYSENQIIPIYFKTGFESIFKLTGIYYKYYGDKFLKVLQKGIEMGIKNSIFADFVDYLNELQNSIVGFEIKDKWGSNDWKGFYLGLQNRMRNINTNWHYVPNANNGFYAFYWNIIPFSNEKGHVFIQLEQETLCYKIRVDEKNKQSLFRNKWSDIILKVGKENGVEIRRPKRFGQGLHMTFGFVSDYRVFSNGQLDWVLTIEKIKEAERVLNIAANNQI